MVGQKTRPENDDHLFCQFLADLRIFFTRRFLSKITVKWLPTIPPHLAYLVKLYTMSAKQAINDKLQCIIATYLRYGGVVNNQIKNGLLLSL